MFLTKRYESFNHVFRLTCVYSNRQAPSRDTCNVFAYHDIIKHVATGGFWMDSQSKRWIQAGSGILKYIAENPKQRSYLGIPETRDKVPGKLSLSS